jgi:hypothetical protein
MYDTGWINDQKGAIDSPNKSQIQLIRGPFALVDKVFDIIN